MESDFRSFLRQQLPEGLPKGMIHFGAMFSGGIAELPFQYYLLNMRDLDQMKFRLNCCAISPDDPFPQDFNETIYTIEYISDHPGHARLRHAEGYLTGNEVVILEWPLKGPAHRLELIRLTKFSKITQQVEAVLRDFGLEPELPVDAVHCVISPYWPAQASGWITRSRKHGWPAEDVITRVVKGGCHFVAKPHPNCANDSTMFRLSFSRAEAILINSWNPIQKYIYHIIRLLKTDIENLFNRNGYKTSLSTYHFKTLMLWACEEKPSTFWNENSVEKSVRHLLCQMIEWLREKRCRNYFIPENNMLDHLPDSFSFEKEIGKILDVIVVGERIHSKMMTVPIVGENTIVPIAVSNKLITILFLTLRRHFCYLDPLQEDWSPRTSQPSIYDFSLISSEFRNLFLGIIEHVRLSKGTEEKFIKCRFGNRSKAFKYLVAAYCEDLGMSQLFVQMDDTVLSVVGRNFCHEKCNFQPTEDITSLISYVTGVTSMRRRLKVLDTEAAATILRCIGHCGNDQLLPKASYFVSAACFANFLYTYTKEYLLSLNICQDALVAASSVYLSTTRGHIYLGLCSILLTSKLMPVYDEAIQTVFGFTTLFNYMRFLLERKSETPDASSSNVPPPIIQHLSPIHFIEYVAYRCEEEISKGQRKASRKRRERPFHIEFDARNSDWVLTVALSIML